MLDDHAAVALDRSSIAFAELRRRHRLSDDHVPGSYGRPYLRKPVWLQFVVASKPQTYAFAQQGRILKLLGVGPVGALLVLVALILDRPEYPSLDGLPVDDERVLLVEPRPAHDRNDDIDARRRVARVQYVVDARRDQGALRDRQHVRDGVHAYVVIETGNADGLLAHRRLVGVTRRLVVIGEWNERRAESVDHRRVELVVRVFLRAVVHPHAHLEIHLLLFVYVLDDASAKHTLPQVLVRW